MKHKLAVIAVLAVTVMALMAPALADRGYQERPPGERPEVNYKPEVPGAPKLVAKGGVLPITGSDLTLFAGAGALAVGVGAAMVKRRRAKVTRS
jgi:LPXTG-motif cell wall-anchored protein